MNGIYFLIIAVVVIAGVGCSFLFMDFGASRSETSVNSMTAKFEWGEEEAKVSGAKVSGDIYLYVDGGEEFDSVLGDELERELEGIAWRLIEVAKLKDEFDGQLVAVTVIRNDIDYTPLYSRAEINVLYFFSSSGESEYFKKFKREKSGGKDVIVRHNCSKGPQIIKKGEISLRDTSYGIFSPKYYKRHLADRLARVIQAGLKQELKNGARTGLAPKVEQSGCGIIIHPKFSLNRHKTVS
ncbi:MAG: hypothetical protein OCU22_09980 [Canidatus Methanoxibalbensis ujae]|nr:hypothetical protein [Candidatus Methanoxibalbensis ujae]